MQKHKQHNQTIFLMNPKCRKRDINAKCQITRDKKVALLACCPIARHLNLTLGMYPMIWANDL